MRQGREKKGALPSPRLNADDTAKAFRENPE